MSKQNSGGKTQRKESPKSVRYGSPVDDKVQSSHSNQVNALKKMLLTSIKHDTNENVSNSQVSMDASLPSKKTPPREKKKKQGPAKFNSSSPFFASSSFQNSPDPISVPMPDFDEYQSSFFSLEGSSPSPSIAPTSVFQELSGSLATEKTQSLRKLLKISS